jgi:hypothetical protein
MTPEELFTRWFVAPIQTLEKLDQGDGAFVALMSVLPLYERGIVGRLKLAGTTATDDAVKAEVERDLIIQPAVRAKFWAIFRNGFMHQGMGLDGKTKWRISGSYGHSPTLLTKDGVDYVCIDPWKFAAHVLKMFTATPALITVSESFPFATIFVHD